MALKGKQLYVGLTMMVVGLLLLGRSTGFFGFGLGGLIHFLLPYGFIVLGIWMIIRKRKAEDRLYDQMQSDISCGNTPAGSSATTQDGAAADPNEFARSQAEGATRSEGPPAGGQKSFAQPQSGNGHQIKYTKYLGDMAISFDNICIENVEVTVGLGDIEARLQGCKLHKGLNRICISGFFGDIRVMIPKDVEYFVHASGFFGDIELGGQRTSGFGNTLEYQSNGYEAAESKVYIAVSTFLSDIRVFQV